MKLLKKLSICFCLVFAILFSTNISIAAPKFSSDTIIVMQDNTFISEISRNSTPLIFINSFSKPKNVSIDIYWDMEFNGKLVSCSPTVTNYKNNLSNSIAYWKCVYNFPNKGKYTLKLKIKQSNTKDKWQVVASRNFIVE